MRAGHKHHYSGPVSKVPFLHAISSRTPGLGRGHGIHERGEEMLRRVSGLPSTDPPSTLPATPKDFGALPHRCTAHASHEE